MKIIPESVRQKIRFARVRLDDLSKLIASNRLASDPDIRHQLTQEFFFHLVVAIDFLAQLVNESYSFNIPIKKVTISEVIKKLEKADPSNPILAHLKSLTANTHQLPLPTDPYSDEGLIYRLITYRNEVVHRNTNPFHFFSAAGPKVAFFYLDPRDQKPAPSDTKSSVPGMSTQSVEVDLAAMLRVVEARCQSVLTILPKI